MHENNLLCSFVMEKESRPERTESGRLKMVCSRYLVYGGGEKGVMKSCFGISANCRTLTKRILFAIIIGNFIEDKCNGGKSGEKALCLERIHLEKDMDI